MTTIDTTGNFSSGILIGDSNVRTSYNGSTISSALELQSTDKALTLTRQTTAELSAIATPINGMIAYNSTSKGFVKYDSIEGDFTGNERLFAVASIGVQAVNIADMALHPFQLIAGVAGAIIVPLKATIYYTAGEQYGGGGDIQIQYGSAAEALGQNAFNSTIAKEFLVGNNDNSIIELIPNFSSFAAPINTGIYISNFGDQFYSIFPGTAVKVNIWYNIITIT